MKLHIKRGESGTTLVELIVSMGVFLVFMAIAIPTFIFVNKMFGEIQTKQELNKKGQRILDYMAEEIRLAGLFVGANPNVVFCPGKEPTPADSLELSSNVNQYDELTFFTSEQVMTTSNVGSPFLTVAAPGAGVGDIQLSVNAPDINQVSGMKFGSNNGRAFITFDTVQPTIGLRVYQATAFAGSVISIDPIAPLVQIIPAGSNVYSVVRKRFSVDTASSANARNLRIVKWDKDCDRYSEDLLSSHDRNGTNLWGGVDALQFEFVTSEGNVSATVGSITGVRAINIWMLVRGDFEEKDYTNKTVYNVGTMTGGAPVTGVTLGPFNDHYRRVLLSKRVEVKNLEK